jgi:hypothetical protein
VNVKYSYDEKCLDLARHFYPMQSIAFLEALAQTIQDCVEGREEIPSEPTPRYQCMVEGCPINHVSKRDVCSTVETSPVAVEKGVLVKNGHCTDCGGINEHYDHCLTVNRVAP